MDANTQTLLNLSLYLGALTGLLCSCLYALLYTSKEARRLTGVMRSSE